MASCGYGFTVARGGGCGPPVGPLRKPHENGARAPDMGGQFNNKNAGKRGISLNIRNPKGLQIAKDLVRICDVVAEGFSPGVLQRLGLGFDVIKSIRPDITDPQLRHLNWLTEVTGTKIGTWPIYELPMKLSRTPAYIGGPTNRGAPCYGEDNMWVLTELLGRSPSDVERLAEEGVI
jgi:crotonobetainyl-CoA:carnitine CoA-transferase CaiB-like acyl-CoA transferase